MANKKEVSAATLSIKPAGWSDYGRRSADEVSERFLKFASLLEKNEFLSLYVRSERIDLVRAHVTSNHPAVTEKDYKWIFGKCAEVAGGKEKEDLPEEASLPVRAPKYYALVPLHGEGKKDLEEAYRHFGDSKNSLHRNLTELIEAFLEARTGIHITAGADGTGVCIEMKKKPSLWTRALVSIAFPDTALVEISAPSFPAAPEHCLPEVQIRNSLAQLFYRLMSDAEKKEMDEEMEDFVFYDLEEPEPEVEEAPAADYRAQLEELIGLEEVKAQVNRITAFARMTKSMEASGKANDPVVLNMEFVGNPGTAKTTVARILAGILFETGILSDDRVVEVGRADLVAKYTGETAEKVKQVFQSAKGKLLFIDEAYSLVEHWENGYGDEAISTIVQEMENNRKDTVVIFAGYPDKMKEFFSRNPGLRSRVPFTITFSDYSEEEMVRIAGLEARKRGFEITETGKEKLAALFASAAEDPEKGNGRFCRNMVENAILNYASRVYGEPDASAPEVPSAQELTEADFPAPEPDKRETQKKRRMGFVADINN